MLRKSGRSPSWRGAGAVMSVSLAASLQTATLSSFLETTATSFAKPWIRAHASGPMWCRNKLGRLAGGLFAAGKAPPDCKLAPASAGAFLRFWRPFGGSLARVYWALAGLIWRLKVTHPLIHK